MSSVLAPAPDPADSLPIRLWRYQAIRFPVLAYSVLVLAFSAASAAYSRVIRGADGFITWPLLLVGAATTLVCFFMLRVLDEHKDQHIDAVFRPELPVPSGWISLRELRWIGGSAVVLTVIANALLAPRLLLALLLVAIWAALMTREFFVAEWLRAHPAAYLLSHMAIMPAIDVYTTGLDWLAAGAPPPVGLLSFLAVTFMNGVLVEVGRKLRTPGEEREGVDTYTKAWGLRIAPLVWTLALLSSSAFALLAAQSSNTVRVTLAVLLPATAVALVPAVRFLNTPTATWARRTERASQLWPLLTYLVLGGAPYVLRALGGGD